MKCASCPLGDLERRTGMPSSLAFPHHAARMYASTSTPALRLTSAFFNFATLRARLRRQKGEHKVSGGCASPRPGPVRLFSEGAYAGSSSAL